MEWEWRLQPQGTLLRVSAVGNANTGGSIDQQHAYAVVSWFSPRLTRRSRVRLELTADPTARYWWADGLHSNYSQGIGERSLSLAWLDLLALAEGAPELTVVMRAPGGAVVDRTTLDAKLVLEGKRQVADGLGRLSEAMRDYSRQCRIVDDVDPSIVLTRRGPG